MWHEIANADDINQFMEVTNNLHDSCLKELAYKSGAYVDAETMGMYPINDKRSLKVLIQRQEPDFPAVEMEFQGLTCLKMVPADENRTCEILDAALFLKDGMICWCAPADLRDFGPLEGVGTFICAERLRWRIETALSGDETFYQPPH